MRNAVLCGLLLGATAYSQSVADALRARIGDFPGTVSLYAKNLETNVTVGIRENERVRTASTIKLPILLSVFDAVGHGRAQWTDVLKVTSAEKTSGSGIIATEISDGVQLPLRDVANLMIVLSDNTATNMIIERFTADAVNAYLDTIGITSTRLMRKILSGAAAAASASAAGKLPENQRYGLGVSTPRDMVTILEKLDRGQIVSPDASRDILAILKRCQDNTGIRRRTGGVPVANKTGALDALRADVGIVYARTGRIAMAITVDGIPKVEYTPDNPGSILIADLAKILVDRLAGER